MPKEVELRFGNKVLTKETDVSEKIHEIIGLDRNQFAQIAMIAQGDFRELLMASSSKRMPLLRKVFRTEKYDTLKIRLGELTINAKHDKETAGSLFNSMKQEIRMDPEDADSTEENALSENQMIPEEIIAFVGRLTEQDEKKYKALTDEQTVWEQKGKEAESLLKKAEELAVHRQTLAKLIEQIGGQEKKIATLAQNLTQAKEKLPESETLREKANQLKILLPHYEQLDALGNECDSLRE
ncbi:MAG: hypothetical protein K2I93_07690, partial [Oscillospiraceae bacterium]|nr:hypothetical protein [Oscillospiraceae bacterium]